MKKVLASVASAPGYSEIQEFSMPKVEWDSGLLKVEAAGVCGTDVGAYAREEPPRILGHEVVGHIVELGAGAGQRWGVQKGDRVVVEEYLPCGHCDRCRTTDFRLCAATDSRAGGVRYGSTPLSVNPALWGGYSQYMYLHPNSILHKAPENVPAEQLALALPLSNGFEWACVEGKAGPAGSVVIIGPGQQGLACVLAAKIAGAKHITVLGLGRDPHRLELATLLGADLAINLEDPLGQAELECLIAAAATDLVIDTAQGNTSTLTLAISMLAQRGTVLISTAAESVDGLPMKSLQWKCATVRGVRGHSYASVEWAISLIASGRYPLEKMCSHKFGLDNVDGAIRSTGGQTSLETVHVTVDPWTLEGERR
jgi:threonine dehydrogenase-like Zn-dependent dehydrogenase